MWHTLQGSPCRQLFSDQDPWSLPEGGRRHNVHDAFAFCIISNDACPVLMGYCGGGIADWAIGLAMRRGSGKQGRRLCHLEVAYDEAAGIWYR